MGGSPVARASGFGMQAVELDGIDVEEVWHEAHEAITRARRGDGPTLLHARCTHLEGHFLGDPVMRIARRPFGPEMRQQMMSQAKALLIPSGAPLRQRLAGVRTIGSLLKGAREQESRQRDPLVLARSRLDDAKRIQQLEMEVIAEIQRVVESVAESM
jgi:TPP-dependent pyruvate/acetoin dehydrogenase alpha subunit